MNGKAGHARAERDGLAAKGVTATSCAWDLASAPAAGPLPAAASTVGPVPAKVAVHRSGPLDSPAARGLAASVAAHLLVVAIVSLEWRGSPVPLPRETAMAVELVPIPASPTNQTLTVAPGPKQVEVHDAPDPVKPKFELPKTPVISVRAPVVVPDQTPPRPTPPRPDRQSPRPPAQQTTAPPSVPLPPRPTAGALALGTPSASDRIAQQTWQGEVLARLERNKRYPPDSLRAGEQDQVMVTISIDRSGRVLSRSISRSRGFGGLDQEVLALVARSSPLPAPPSSVSDRDLTFIVPVDFSTSGTRNRRRR